MQGFPAYNRLPHLHTVMFSLGITTGFGGNGWG